MVRVESSLLKLSGGESGDPGATILKFVLKYNFNNKFCKHFTLHNSFRFNPIQFKWNFFGNFLTDENHSKLEAIIIKNDVTKKF